MSLKYFKVTEDLATFAVVNPEGRWLRQGEVFRGKVAENQVGAVYIYANHVRDLMIKVPRSYLTEVTEEDWKAQAV